MGEQEKKFKEKQTPLFGQGKDKKPRKDNNFQWQKAAKTLGFWVFFIIGTILLSQFFQFNQDEEQEITYSEYRAFLEAKKIEKASVLEKEKEFHGQLKIEESIFDGNNNIRTYQKFKVILPLIDRDTIEEWNKYGVQFNFENAPHDWMNYFLGFYLYHNYHI